MDYVVWPHICAFKTKIDKKKKMVINSQTTVQFSVPLPLDGGLNCNLEVWNKAV